MLFVHRVDGLDPGIYALPRTPAGEARLREALRPDWLWADVEGVPAHVPLRLLVPLDVRRPAATVSCHQAIAADGCFAVAMLAELDAGLAEGAHVYRRLHWEAGMLGQVLYLQAELEGMRATGIGCFFDDAVHELLGVRDTALQTLYHFTVGGPLEDPRLATHGPYEHLRDRGNAPAAGGTTLPGLREARERPMKKLLLSCATATVVLAAPTLARADYVCTTGYVPSAGAYGDDGYVYAMLTSQPDCGGNWNGVKYYCSAHATSSYCASSTSFRYARESLLGLAAGLRDAIMNPIPVYNINASCNGGGSTCGGYMQFEAISMGRSLIALAVGVGVTAGAFLVGSDPPPARPEADRDVAAKAEASRPSVSPRIDDGHRRWLERMDERADARVEDEGAPAELTPPSRAAGAPSRVRPEPDAELVALAEQVRDAKDGTRRRELMRELQARAAEDPDGLDAMLRALDAVSEPQPETDRPFGHPRAP